MSRSSGRALGEALDTRRDAGREVGLAVLVLAAVVARAAAAGVGAEVADRGPAAGITDRHAGSARCVGAIFVALARPLQAARAAEAEDAGRRAGVVALSAVELKALIVGGDALVGEERLRATAVG